MKAFNASSLRSTATVESPKVSVRFSVPSEGENAASTPSEQHVAPPPPPIVINTSTVPRIRTPPPESIHSSINSQETRSPRGSKHLLLSSSLRSNLTREQRDRDPLFFYEIVKTLGVGSMGSVARVQKRTAIIGGSARKPFQQAVRRQRRSQKCLELPLIGGLFRCCLDGKLKHSDDSEQRTFGEGVLRSASSWLDMVEDSSRSIINSRDKPSSVYLPMLRSESIGSLGSSVNFSDSKGSDRTLPIQYAMKSIHLDRVADKHFLAELRNEIDILKRLDHPHIVRAVETFEHMDQISIIMDLCSGGDLYSRDPYTEEQAARIISSILSAVAYMHGKNIVHRDLKYENVLFVNDSPHSEIKLIDFGLSKVYGDNSEIAEGVGTIYTMAPEVLRGTYSFKADIWSVGVIAYMLLSSQMPFYGRKRKDIVEQILKGQYDFRGRRWKRISEQAKSFIEEFIVLDAEERVDAQTAMSATWLNRRFVATTRGPDANEENMARHAMLRYAGYTKLKKMALMVVAHKSSSEEIGILRKVFQKYDKKGDGSLGYEDFCNALAGFGHSDEDLREMFEAVDLDGTGTIRYTEFLSATIEAHGAVSEQRLAEAFDRLDSDDSGFISAENLMEMLGADFPRHEIDQILKEASMTKDNKVSYAEFLQLWEEKHDQERSEQLDMLGTEIMGSFRENTTELASLAMPEDREPVQARASFILQKHDGKRTSFAGDVQEEIFHDAREYDQAVTID